MQRLSIKSIENLDIPSQIWGICSVYFDNFNRPTDAVRHLFYNISICIKTVLNKPV